MLCGPVDEAFSGRGLQFVSTCMHDISSEFSLVDVQMKLGIPVDVVMITNKWCIFAMFQRIRQQTVSQLHVPRGLEPRLWELKI